VVWPHHVGEIRGGPNENGQWLDHFGNDGNAQNAAGAHSAARSPFATSDERNCAVRRNTDRLHATLIVTSLLLKKPLAYYSTARAQLSFY
jgi:hypothetical protein